MQSTAGARLSFRYRNSNIPQTDVASLIKQPQIEFQTLSLCINDSSQIFKEKEQEFLIASRATVGRRVLCHHTNSCSSAATNSYTHTHMHTQHLYSVQPRVLATPRLSPTHQTRGVVIYS